MTYVLNDKNFMKLPKEYSNLLQHLLHGTTPHYEYIILLILKS